MCARSSTTHAGRGLSRRDELGNGHRDATQCEPYPCAVSHSLIHSHGGHPPKVRIAFRAQVIVVTTLAVLGAITLAGVIALWPAAGRPAAEATSAAQFAGKGVTFSDAQITTIHDGCPALFSGSASAKKAGPGGTQSCQMAKVRLLNGKGSGNDLALPILWPYSKAGLQPGDKLRLTVTPTPNGQVSSADAQNGAVGSTIGQSFAVFGIERNQPLVWWAIAFVVIVIAVGALRGLLAVVSLALSGLMIFLFVVPALIGGEPGFFVGLVASFGMMFIVLFLTHGISMRTCAALLGTLGGIAITAGIAQLEVITTRLSGVGDEATGTIPTLTSAIDPRGLITCAIIISGLGVLNDITVTQASAAWELRAAAPHMSRGAMFASALRIGRDHIASSIYTIVFAYAGTGLAVLVVVSLYNRPAFELLTHEDIATELVRTLCSAIGLVLAMPVTTAIAIALLPADRTRQATAAVATISPA